MMPPLKHLKLKFSFLIAAWLMILVSYAFLPTVPHPDTIVTMIGNILMCALAAWSVTIGIPAMVFMMVAELFRREFWQVIRTLAIFMGSNVGLTLWALTPTGEMIVGGASL